MKLSEWLTQLDPRARSWHPKVIQQIAKAQGVRTYLEVGIYRGETLRKLARFCELVVGIDIDAKAISSIPSKKNIELFKGTVQEYAKHLGNNLPKFDLAFIDANHDVNFVVKDFDTTVPLMGNKSLILMHDTWPRNAEYSDPRFCGDAYRAVDILRKKYIDWNFVTIQKHPGLTMAQRVGVVPDWVTDTVVKSL